MIIKSNPLGAIFSFIVIAIILIITSATFLLWVFSIIIVLLIDSIAAHCFIIEDDKIIVKHYTFFWFYKEFNVSDIKKIVLTSGSYGNVHIKINGEKFIMGGRSLEYLKKRFEKLKEKGIDVEVKSIWF